MTEIGIVQKENRELLPQIRECCPELAGWYGEITGGVCGLVDAAVIQQVGETTYRTTFFTDRHVYAVRSRPPCLDSPGGYLGCVAAARKAMAGEGYTRGNDLADGPYSYETWQRIVKDILAYEIMPLGE